jgi:hypothetical protein
MRPRYSIFLALYFCPMTVNCQTEAAPPYKIYAGMAYFSNSFNGAPNLRSPLIGWDTAVAFPAWRGLRFKIDVSGTDGENQGAEQRSLFILGGAEYGRKLGPERLFAHALVGDVGMNRYWGPNKLPGETASFAVLLGGGVDTPIGHYFSIRAEGDLQHTNLDLVESLPAAVPYRVPGMPNFMGRFSTGLVWTPRLGAPASAMIREPDDPRPPTESELVSEYRSSFGHVHFFAGTWWSYFHVAGFEYDRHTWGTFLHARLDYVAEILPLVVLEQPSKTDRFGDPLSTDHTTVMGLGISPIGVRMLWREGRAWKPYYIAKGGMIGFTQKALSANASYENFSLQQSTGIQFRISDEWDVRAGVSDFHFSNGFLVPSNPGIDDLMYTFGLSRRFHIQSESR